MKKNVILILCLFLVSCKNDTKIAAIEKQVYLSNNSTKTESKKITNNCSVDDFLLLRKKDVQQDFFKKMDSIFVVQYPNKKDRENTINVTPEILNRYLKDINEQSLRDSLVVFNDVTLANKEYNFKFIPKSFHQWKTSNYKNTIYIRYSPNHCSFGLYINYSCIIDFEDEEDKVIEEHLIFYHFKIVNGKIVDFGRNEVG